MHNIHEMLKLTSKLNHKILHIGAFGCLQTNTALPQLCNISCVSADTSSRKAQCIFALLCTAKNIISKHRKILKNIPFVCSTS